MTLLCNKTQPHRLRITSRLTAGYGGSGSLRVHQKAVEQSSHITAATLKPIKAAASIN